MKVTIPLAVIAVATNGQQIIIIADDVTIPLAVIAVATKWD